jgi:beta-N-acetylhexosaminidase
VQDAQVSSIGVIFVPSNVIVGCSSTRLSEQEKSLFNELQPWGIILFARNINNPAQVIALIEDCKQAMKRDELMVFIDQEGGRVSRLPNTHWRIPPSPTVFANMYEENLETAKRACLLNATLTGVELKALGINANCAPMLDLPQRNANSIISERALGATPQKVIELTRQISNGLKRAGVAPVIKHMPGHGRATSDSHLELPEIGASLNELNNWDFVPFKAMCEETMAMTAHIVFNQIDRNLPATISRTVVDNVMRDIIGFDGLIMTDDLNMEALSGTVASRAEKAIAAGCDIALHCSGEFDEMKSLLLVASELTGNALVRAFAAQKVAFQPVTDLSASELKKELDALMKDYG